MTYCLGIKVQDGLVAIADTRLTSGTETTTGKKITLSHGNHQALFIMTSGLRSVRDKAITYFEEVIEANNTQYHKMYQAVNAFAQQLRKVRNEDKAALEDAGYKFNLHSIVGGQFEGDDEHKLFRLYAEGNWVEIGTGTPFVIIGNSGYGKPVLDRVLRYQSSLNIALKTGFLSFDSTHISANDVGYPLDVVMYKKDSYQLVEHRYQEEDLKEASLNWRNSLIESIRNTPEDWTQAVLGKLDHPRNQTPQ